MCCTRVLRRTERVGEGRRRGGRRIHGLAPAEDVERELRAHLGMREEELISAGWDPAAAQVEARRLFGDYPSIRRECRESARRRERSSRLLRFAGEAVQDMRFALRWLRRERGFAIIAIVTLGLGIGANSAVFSVVKGVLLTPLPYPEPDQLVAVREVTERSAQAAVSWPNVADWSEAAQAVAVMAAHYTVPATVLGGAEAVRLPVAVVSRGFFDVMGVGPARGRAFSDEELMPGGRPAVVVSHGFWTEQLGARADLGGARVEVHGMTADVVGVMPPGFDYPDHAELWLPLELTPVGDRGSRTAHNFRVTGRLAAGVPPGAAARELSAIAQQIRLVEDSDAVGVSVRRLRDHLVGDRRTGVLILLGASVFVLLIACTNLASALLARAAGRRRELVVRVALGAGRPRLVRQLLTETVLLGAAGGAVGMLLAYQLLLAIGLAPAALPRLDEVRLDGWVVAFTAAISLATALAFGIAPALRATAVHPHDVLTGSGHGTESRRQRRVWPALVAAEVALALLLLVGSGLLIRSFAQVMRVDPGFDPDRALAITLDLPASRYDDHDARVRYYSELLEEVGRLAGVEHAGITTALPLAGFDPAGLFHIEGSGLTDRPAAYRIISPDYFAAMRTRLLRGRVFDEGDRAGSVPVVVINRRMAEEFFPGVDPIGRRITTGGMDATYTDNIWLTIVGVVDDVHHASLTAAPEPGYYLPYAQRPHRTLSASLIVRTAGDPLVIAPALQRTIRQQDADVPVDVRTLRGRIGETLAERRFVLSVLGGFALVALVLSAVGIYGVVTYVVAQRTREIGIRMALGARSGKVIWAIGRVTITAALVGVAAGLGGAMLLSRLIEAMLFEVGPADPLTLAGVALALLATAVVATLVPARHATRVDPMETLRAE